MPSLIDVNIIEDSRGKLGVIDNSLPFEIKRFFIYDVKDQRGGHRHKKTLQALICLSGNCKISVQTEMEDLSFILSDKKTCLILEPEDWHTMEDFSDDAVLMVLASTHHQQDDYIFEPWREYVSRS